MLFLVLISLCTALSSEINDCTDLESTGWPIGLSDSVNLHGCHLDSVDSGSSSGWTTIDGATVVIIDSCTFNAMTFVGILLKINAAGGSVFLVSSSFTNLVIGSGGATIIYVQQCDLCQILGVSVHVLSGDATAIAVYVDLTEPQVIIHDCELRNVRTENGGAIRVPNSASVSHITFRSCVPLYFFDFSGASLESMWRVEVSESTFLDTLMSLHATVIAAAVEQAIITNCHFINTTVRGGFSLPMCYIGCDFQPGGRPEAIGISWGAPYYALVLTSCQFRDLKTALNASGDGSFNALQVCGCAFSDCGQGIVGRWSSFTMIQSTFDGLTGEACLWQVRCRSLIIDLCFFCAPSESGRVTLSFAGEGGTVFVGGSIARSCFLGGGQRMAFATALPNIDLSIGPSVCFESDDPFGDPAHDNELWHPSTECQVCDLVAEEQCDKPGIIHPLTPFASPTLPDVYTLPPKTGGATTAREGSPLETRTESSTAEFTGFGFDSYHRNRPFVATALFLFFGFT
jgi:hypothetical protein